MQHDFILFIISLLYCLHLLVIPEIKLVQLASTRNQETSLVVTYIILLYR
jgi:hypothetical protein